MSCLGIFCNYDSKIRAFEQTAPLESCYLADPKWQFDCQVECHSVHWTFLHKVTTFIIGLLAVLGVAAGGALFAIGIINKVTALAIMGGSGVLLLSDLAVILYFRKQHAHFLEQVGWGLTEYKQETHMFSACDSIAQTLLDSDIEIKKAAVSDRYQAISIRTEERTFRVEVYQSKEAYEKREKDFKGKAV